MICAVLLTYMLVFGYALLGLMHWWEWSIFVALHVIAGQILLAKKTNSGS